MSEMNTAKAWTAEEIEDIWRRYRNGETPALLAEEYGRSAASIKGVIRRRKEKESKKTASAAAEETETGVDAELDDIEEAEEEAEAEAEETPEEAPDTETEAPDDDWHTAVRTYVKPSLFRPRRKEMGRFYTGTRYRMRKKM